MKIYEAEFELICKRNERRMMGMIKMLPVYGFVYINIDFKKYDGVSV